MNLILTTINGGNMKNSTDKSYTSHPEMFQLLPWYVNKTLSGQELKAVELHLSVCLVCKRELIQLQKLADAVVREDTLDSVENASFARLKKRLHQKPLVQDSIAAMPVINSDSRPLILNLKKSGQRKPAEYYWPLRTALALAAVLLISLVVPLRIATNLNAVNDFRTLSDAEPKALATDEIRVVFAEGISRKKIHSVISRINGQFVDNEPTEQGVYTVKLSNTGINKVMDTLNLLKKDENVIFAEPGYALLSSTHGGGQ